MATGVNLSADGQRLASRSYLGGWEWKDAPDRRVAASASIFDISPQGLQLALEWQCEAIAYAPGGGVLLIGSEHGPTPLHEIRRVGGE